MQATFKDRLYNLILRIPFGLRILQWRYQIKQRKKAQQKIKQQKHKEQQKIKRQRKRQRNELKIEKQKLSNKTFYFSRSISLLEKFQHYIQTPVENAIAFEIGGGLYLAAAIGMSAFGFKKVITTDIQTANPQYVQLVCRYYRKHYKELGMQSFPKIKEKFTDDNLQELLLKYFNIDYCVPCDNTNIELPDESVDYVVSHVVFEHVRTEKLPKIVQEAYRILRHSGIMYVTVDFRDHRAQSHSELTIYDYLQYTSEEWLQYEKKENHLYGQNRLRWPDHLANFTAVGFEIIHVKHDTITDADRAAFATVKVADEFKNKYSEAELLEKGVKVILRKP